MAKPWQHSVLHANDPSRGPAAGKRINPVKQALLPNRIGVRGRVGVIHVYPPPPCISYALVQATVGVGTVLIWDLILIWCQA